MAFAMVWAFEPSTASQKSLKSYVFFCVFNDDVKVVSLCSDSFSVINERYQANYFNCLGKRQTRPLSYEKKVISPSTRAHRGFSSSTNSPHVSKNGTIRTYSLSDGRGLDGKRGRPRAHARLNKCFGGRAIGVQYSSVSRWLAPSCTLHAPERRERERCGVSASFMGWAHTRQPAIGSW